MVQYGTVTVRGPQRGHPHWTGYPREQTTPTNKSCRHSHMIKNIKFVQLLGMTRSVEKGKRRETGAHRWVPRETGHNAGSGKGEASSTGEEQILILSKGCAITSRYLPSCGELPMAVFLGPRPKLIPTCLVFSQLPSIHSSASNALQSPWMPPLSSICSLNYIFTGYWRFCWILVMERQNVPER